MGATYPFERFTDQAKQVMTRAQGEAERSHHSYIGTEHLLLGMFQVEEAIAALILAELGVDITVVRDAIKDILGRNEHVRTKQIVPTSRVKKVIEISFEEARRMGDGNVGTQHLLLGLVIEGDGIAAHVLKDVGATLGRVRESLAHLSAAGIHEGMGPGPSEPAGQKRVPGEVGIGRRPERAAALRVIVAEDSLLFREGLSRLLGELGMQVDAQTGSTADLMQLVARHRPDVVVLDIRMPPTRTDEGLVAAVEIRRAHPGVGVLLLGQYVEDTHLVLTLLHEGGGVGYLLKDRVADLDAFSSAINTVARGGSVVDPEVVSTLVTSPRRDPLGHLTDREKGGMMTSPEPRHVAGGLDDLTAVEVLAALLDRFGTTQPPPPALVKLVAELRHVRGEKQKAVSAQDYELAARCYDQERRLQADATAQLDAWRHHTA